MTILPPSPTYTLSHFGVEEVDGGFGTNSNPIGSVDPLSMPLVNKTSTNILAKSDGIPSLSDVTPSTKVVHAETSTHGEPPGFVEPPQEALPRPRVSSAYTSFGPRPLHPNVPTTGTNGTSSANIQANEYEAYVEPEEYHYGTGKYGMLPQALGTRRKLKVVFLGGGVGGINMTYKIKTHMKDVEFVAYEKNSGLGGTWFENKYPGCACDIPSHTYQFTWALNPEWKNYYSTSDDIQSYLLSVVDQHNLRPYFLLRHEITSARWDEKTSHWLLNIKVHAGKDETGKVWEEEEKEDWCDFFINGSGILNNWRWPSIPNLHSFKGTLVHTAKWDRNIVTDDKRVILIGVGSSGVQVLPAIQKRAKHVTHFVRSKTWITPSFAAKYAGPGGGNFAYTEEEKEKFRKDPVASREYSKAIELELNKRWKFVIKDSPAQSEIRQLFTREMTLALSRRLELVDVLLPDFAVGCRRLTPGPGFLTALQAENVEVVTKRIKEVTERGVKVIGTINEHDGEDMGDGEEYEADVIICATGFENSFRPRFKLIGRDGVDLREKWTDRARAYQSAFVDGFPNYFMVMGPGSPSAHGSAIPSTEHISDYCLKVLYKLQTEPIKSIDVKPDVVQELAEHSEQQLKTTAWSSSCSSWFKNGKVNGPLDSLHPGGRLHYFSTLINPRWEDFNYEYSNNRFAHWGNGFTLRELEGRDLTWYWNKGDRLDLFEY